MRLPHVPHRWNITPRQAIALQKSLASRVIDRPTGLPMNLVAGADVAFTRDGTECIAGVVVWSIPDRTVVERAVAVRPMRFPYVPGLLSFREAPALLAAIRKLRTIPDAFMFDGQGFAHPRRFGLACHVGVLMDRPSVGSAKSLLIGQHAEPGSRRGARRPLTDNGEPIGAVLRTRDGVRPVYVSVGHRVDLEQAVDIVLRCGGGYRLPEPTRLADQLVAAAKRGEPI